MCKLKSTSNTNCFTIWVYSGANHIPVSICVQIISKIWKSKSKDYLSTSPSFFLFLLSLALNPLIVLVITFKSRFRQHEEVHQNEDVHVRKSDHQVSALAVLVEDESVSSEHDLLFLHRDSEKRK